MYIVLNINLAELLHFILALTNVKRTLIVTEMRLKTIEIRVANYIYRYCSHLVPISSSSGDQEPEDVASADHLQGGRMI